MNKKPSRASNLGYFSLILLILVGTVFMLSQPRNGEDIQYSDIHRHFEQQVVRTVRVVGDNLFLEIQRAEDPPGELTEITYELQSFSLFYDDFNDIIVEQFHDNIITSFDYSKGWQAPIWFTFIPYILIIVIFIVIWYAMINRAGGGERGGMRYGKIKPRIGSDERKKVYFADVAGADEEKEELQEIVEYLKEPGRYTELGARIPTGVLLVGPPGTGKTLIARAVAGEAGVQFLSISGSDFVELYVGVGASRVRDLFEQAKKTAPCIIFIDEIDAVGRQRGAGMGGGHDEREQTLNQLLVEMDGFGTNEGVIVMAATNRKDILDNALLRPGRFDRQVYVGLPDVKGREAILKVHAKEKPLGDDVDLASLARGTPGFTGADLENLLNEAALFAARRRNRFITMAEMEDAVLKVMTGPEKKSRVITEKERRLTAFHEAGHAVAGKYSKHMDPVHQITIIPRAGIGGMTVYRPQEDKSFQSRRDMFERIVAIMGGRVAEHLCMDDISTGATGDIQQATAIARAMVTQFGMSDRLGPISFDSSGSAVFIGRDFAQTKAYSEKVAAIIDEEIKTIFDRAMARCEKILTEHRDILVKTAEYLLEHETMDGNVFHYLCEHGYLPEKALKKASMFSDTEKDSSDLDPMSSILDQARQEAGRPETIFDDVDLPDRPDKRGNRDETNR